MYHSGAQVLHHTLACRASSCSGSQCMTVEGDSPDTTALPAPQGSIRRCRIMCSPVSGICKPSVHVAFIHVVCTDPNISRRSSPITPACNGARSRHRRTAWGKTQTLQKDQPPCTCMCMCIGECSPACDRVVHTKPTRCSAARQTHGLAWCALMARMHVAPQLHGSGGRYAQADPELTRRCRGALQGALWQPGQPRGHKGLPDVSIGSRSRAQGHADQRRRQRRACAQGS